MQIPDCQSGIFKTAGASSNVKFGGGYVIYTNGSSWCGQGNPYAGGGCACPVGYTTFQTAYDGAGYTYYQCYALVYL